MVSRFVEAPPDREPGRRPPACEAAETGFDDGLQERGAEARLTGAKANGVETIAGDDRRELGLRDEEVNPNAKPPGLGFLRRGGARKRHQGSRTPRTTAD